jgi:hypothetical protein
MRLLQTKASYQSQHRAEADQQASQALAWTSIAVGLTELLATKQLQKTMGVEGLQSAGILRVLGVREVMHGVDLLAHKDPTPGVWSRVFGDLLDGALLGAAATRTKKPGGLALIFAAVTPVVVADLIFAPRLSKDELDGQIHD